MNSIDLYKLKNNTKCVLLNETLVSEILSYFNQSNIKTFKGPKKQVNILKNNKIQNKKDLSENKLIMIMNKLSHNNLNELIKEYLLNPSITIEQYNSIQNEILIKMMKDITFINIYIPFVIKIFTIEKYRLSVEPEFFIKNIMNIISYHYLNLDTDSYLMQMTDRDNESDRLSCLKLINYLIKFNFFNKDLGNYISNQNIIINPTLQTELVKSVETVIKSQPTNDPVNQFIILLDNIIEEFFYLESKEEIQNFINTECKDLNNKNIFCKEILNRYFNDILKKDLIYDLLNYLINQKSLYKSNISKGLLLYLDSLPVLQTKNDSMEKLLKFLKSNNITKNLEHLFKKYKIKINYDIEL